MLTLVRQAVQLGDLKGIERLVRDALDEGADPGEILEAMIDALNHIGDRYGQNRLFIPEITICARTLQRGARVLKPFFAPGERSDGSVIIIGTVKGDLHDVGKNLVGMVADAAGYRVVDLGVDVPSEKFLAALREEAGNACVALSTLLTSSLDNMDIIVRDIRQEFPAVKILVGGTPVDPDFARTIGADACTRDISDVIETLRSWSGTQ